MAQIVSELQDLTYLSWAKARQSSGTAGSFLKSYDSTGARKLLQDRQALFDGLEEATTALWRDAVWSLIWQRWCRLEDLRTA